MKQVYLANDDKIFESEVLCLEHEARGARIEVLEKILTQFSHRLGSENYPEGLHQSFYDIIHELSVYIAGEEQEEKEEDYGF